MNQFICYLLVKQIQTRSCRNIKDSVYFVDLRINHILPFNTLLLCSRTTLFMPFHYSIMYNVSNSMIKPKAERIAKVMLSGDLLDDIILQLSWKAY